MKKYILTSVVVFLVVFALTVPITSVKAIFFFGKAKKENSASYTGAVANTKVEKVENNSDAFVQVLYLNGGETLKAGALM